VTGWTAEEKNLVADAAVRAPSVHNTMPWVLELPELPDGGRAAELYERFDRALPRHDPLGRDRLISCGAALEHVRIALRVLGWEPEVALFPEPGRRDLVARVHARHRTTPSDVDTHAYAAVRARRSHRKPFGPSPVADHTVRWLIAANHTDGTGVRQVSGEDETRALARLLTHAAHALRDDRGYQRELAAWTAAVRDPLPGTGVSSALRRTATLPWAGLIRRTTAVPDVDTLADRLSRECLLLVETLDDGPRDHVLAGAATESVWLAAVGAGLSCALLTQPFQLSEVRAGLVEALSLNGFPQVLLRLGWRGEHSEET
jgi:hypothetical protein